MSSPKCRIVVFLPARSPGHRWGCGWCDPAAARWPSARRSRQSSPGARSWRAPSGSAARGLYLVEHYHQHIIILSALLSSTDGWYREETQALILLDQSIMEIMHFYLFYFVLKCMNFNMCGHLLWITNIISPQQIWPYNIDMQFKKYTHKNVYIHIFIALKYIFLYICVYL